MCRVDFVLLCGAQQGRVLVDQHYLRARCEPQHGPYGLDDTHVGNFGVWLRVPDGLGICGGSFGWSFVRRRVVCIGISEKQRGLIQIC